MEKKIIIISRTPLRITFVGGGTDIGRYYKERGPGAVISAAVNKYIYVTVHRRFDSTIRVSYSRTENVESVDQLMHPTVREALRLLDIDGGIEITSMGDIPAGGTGMGSSSTFLVGLLNALHAWRGEYATAVQLAEEAVRIERGILKEPGGKQDQYIAALGGIQFMEFNRDETVVTTPLIMKEESRKNLQDNLLLLYTGSQRRSAEIHERQSKDAGMHLESYDRMRDLAYSMFKSLVENRWDETGRYLHENWLIKRTLADGISSPAIDNYYKAAMENGATGGKLIGAGGSGFMLFFAPRGSHEAIRKALGLKAEPFEFETLGSRIIYVGD